MKEYIKNNKENLLRVLYLLFLNLGIVSLLIYILNTLTSINFNLVLSQNWFLSIGIFSLTLSVICKYQLNISREKQSSFIESVFHIAPYFFLSILFILAVNQFLKIDFLIDRTLHLTVLGIAFGFLSFYKNRDRVEKEIEEEKEKEELAEKQRADEFGEKFPKQILICQRNV